MTVPTPRTDVLVVGAGPVGLTAALAAHALGVRVTILEACAETERDPGSRALYVHHDSLQLLERISPGLGRRIGDFGVLWRRRRTLYAGRTVYDRYYPPASGTGLPPYASLRQVDTERFLRTTCLDRGVPVVWSAEAERITVNPAGVEVATADGRTWHAGYLIGADGGRSTVRASIGVRLDGVRSNAHHVVVDLAHDPGASEPNERVFHYWQPSLGGRNVLLVPFAGGRQVDVQCLPTDRPEWFSSHEQVMSWLPAVVSPDYRDRVLSVSTYPFHQRVAERFVDGHRRVLLVGDAAHLFAPFGARGMNSGIADAQAAARAVASALRAPQPIRAASAVEDYDRDRRAAAHRNRAAAGIALAHMQPASVWPRARQAAAARLAPLLPRAGTWLERGPYGPRGTAGSARY